MEVGFWRDWRQQVLKKKKGESAEKVKENWPLLLTSRLEPRQPLQAHKLPYSTVCDWVALWCDTGCDKVEHINNKKVIKRFLVLAKPKSFKLNTASFLSLGPTPTNYKNRHQKEGKEWNPTTLSVPLGAGGTEPRQQATLSSGAEAADAPQRRWQHGAWHRGAAQLSTAVCCPLLPIWISSCLGPFQALCRLSMIVIYLWPDISLEVFCHNLKWAARARINKIKKMWGFLCVCIENYEG